MYGREGITSDKIGFIQYQCQETYEKAVASHIEELWKIHDAAELHNKDYQRVMKDYFDQKRIGNKKVTWYLKGDLVWLDIRRLERSKAKGFQNWIGPCEIIDVRPGPLFDVQDISQKDGAIFTRMHPQFLKLYKDWENLGDE
jgi:hypothetical protein